MDSLSVLGRVGAGRSRQSRPRRQTRSAGSSQGPADPPNAYADLKRPALEPVTPRW